MSNPDIEEAVAVATPRLVFNDAAIEAARANTPEILVGNVTPVIDKMIEPAHQSTSSNEEGTQDMAPTNFDEMTVDELRQQQEEIDQKIKAKQLAERKEVIDEIVKVVVRYKIPTEELVEALGGMKAKRKGVKAKAKYKDPDSGAIWSGRGKEPAWIKDKDRKPFTI